MIDETKMSAVLKPAFLTVVQRDGVSIDWSEARELIQHGYQVKIDVTQSKSVSLKDFWLVFGMIYLGKLSIE